MKRKFNRVLCIIFALLVCCLCGVTAFAAEPVSVNIGAEVKLRGAVPESPENYVLILRSVDTGEEIICNVNGEGKANFEGLVFDRAGVYNYIVTQQKGENSDCIYDDTVYYLTVTVFYAEDSYDFDIAAKVYKGGIDEKQDSIVFENIYKEITTEVTTEATTKTEDITKVTKVTEKTTEKVIEDVDNGDTPYTGDNNRMQMWIGLFAIGFVFVVGAGIVLVAKKKDFEEIN